MNHQLAAIAVVYNRLNRVFKFDALLGLQVVAGLSDPVQETRVMLERFIGTIKSAFSRIQVCSRRS
jgi:hypothetical protein